MTAVTPKFGMGASVLRVEDGAFITGKGRYTDDIRLDGVLHGYVLRSPVANGRFTIGALEAARVIAQAAGKATHEQGADQERHQRENILGIDGEGVTRFLEKIIERQKRE